MAGRTSSGKLQVTLPSDTEILMSRVFDAPRRLVFETMTRPEHVRRWWVPFPDRYRMTVCEIDLRVGGTWRFVMTGTDGSEVGFRGEYLEIEAPARIVNTEIFEAFPDNPSRVTVTLEERGGRTYYQARVVYDSRQTRDAVIESGMEHGAAISLDQLEDVARSLDRVEVRSY